MATQQLETEHDHEEDFSVQEENAYFQTLLVSDSAAIQENHPTTALTQFRDASQISKNWEVDLIEEVRRYDCLWNTTSRAFKETPKKSEAWRRISMKLNVEVKIIQNTWDKLRENFRKALNRRKKATKSGASGNPISTCRFFKELSFLTDIIGVRNTQSNLQPDIFTPPASPAVENPPYDYQSDFFSHLSPSNPACSQESTPAAKKSFFSATSSHSTSISESPGAIQTMKPINASREHNRKRKPEPDSLQVVLERAIQADVQKANETAKESVDEDELFCKSLIPTFKRLSRKKNKKAKIKVMEIFIEMESDSD